MKHSKITICVLIGLGLVPKYDSVRAAEAKSENQIAAKHQSIKDAGPSKNIVLPQFGSIATKPIEYRSLATFTVDSSGNTIANSSTFALDRDQEVLVEFEATPGDSGYTRIVNADGTQFDYHTSSKQTVSSGTWAHHANGTIWGQGEIKSSITYTRLVPDCSRLTHLSAVGWSSGHKTNHCKAHGYDGVTNTSHGGNDYRKNGGGWCFSGAHNACQAALDNGDVRAASGVKIINAVPSKPSRATSDDRVH